MLPVPKRTGAGRKSLYKPEYCDIAIAMGRQGKSQAQIASIFNVDRASLARWAGEHEEFASALARAKTEEQSWWEAKAQSKLGAKHFQAQLWRYSMAARFREDYSEQKQSVDITLDLGSAIAEVIGRRKPAAELAQPGDGAKAVEVASSFGPALEPAKRKE